MGIFSEAGEYEWGKYTSGSVDFEEYLMREDLNPNYS
jgi:hypothetical protein